MSTADDEISVRGIRQASYAVSVSLPLMGFTVQNVQFKSQHLSGLKKVSRTYFLSLIRLCMFCIEQTAVEVCTEFAAIEV